MGWRDRDYNRGREAMFSFLSSPGSILNWSVPLVTRPGFYVRLHFWLLLSFLFSTIRLIWARAPWFFIPADMALVIGILLVHEFGHRIMARTVGGDHWEFVLWPAGGMVPPHAPRTAWATFVAFSGGILFTVLLLVGAIAGEFYLLSHAPTADSLNPLGKLPVVMDWGSHFLTLTVMTSISIILINLFPAYWFDGGYIWQSILQPWVGLYKAISITCLAGMVLCVPLFILSLMGGQFLGMVVCALLFADCFNRRRALAAAGPGVVTDDDASEYNYMDTSPRKARKAVKRGWFKTAKRKADKERAEQAKIDAILTKVHERGLHSLTWWEKRTLRKATERQRQRDLAERL